MQRFLLILFVVLSTATIQFGQKVDLDEEKAVTYSRDLPDFLMPADFQYYGVTISADPSMLRSFSLSETELSDKIKIGGFRKVAKGGNFHVELIIDAPLNNPNVATIEKKTEESKSKEGVVTKTTTYWWQHNLIVPTAFRVMDQNGETLMDELLSSSENGELIQSKIFNSYDAAKKDRRANAKSGIYSAYRNFIEAKAKGVNRKINKTYGFPITKKVVTVFAMDSKKNPAFEPWKEHTQNAIAAYKLLTGKGGLEEFRTTMAPIMSFWEGEKNSADPTDKKMKKVFYAASMNLAKANYWAENLAEAKSFATAIAEQKYKKNVGQGMIDRIDRLAKDMRTISASTCQMALEVPEPDPSVLAIEYATERAAKIAEYKDRAMGIGEESQEFNGFIKTADGAKIPVTFVVDYSRYSGLDFQLDGNVKFFKEGEDFVKRQYLDKTKIKEFGFNNNLYRLMEYKPASVVKVSLKNNTRMNYLQIIHESDKIAIYHFYPVVEANNQLGEATDEIVVRKGPTGSDLVSTSGLKFISLKKGLAKLFADCPALVKSIEAGNFKRNDESFKKLAAEFEADCN